MGNDLDAALEDALRILTHSQKSINELRSILTNKGHREGIIEKTIERLKSLHYLNDLEYALDWGRKRIKRYPIGMELMRLELEKRGIEGDIISKVIRIIYQENNEKEIASHLIAQKLIHYTRPAGMKRSWIIGLLNMRGFSPEVIQDVTEQLIDEDHQHKD